MGRGTYHIPTFVEDEGEEYREENLLRLAAYNRGEWHYQGCAVKAYVSYPIDNQGNRRMEVFTSGGLWGIESDSDSDYLLSVEAEELADLTSHLEVFGIDTANAVLPYPR